ncbi:alpha-amylase family glycosyl hydrolase [Maribacter hydrothermalis]|uniref:Alpha-amylase n=1 Tax=Maribacter hydrothermalis TaxID=1836467 RepID=A0A1B7Z3B7_9FLAO|nr:alpha-amylase family glycosyl hydrolase [Maribacter hydrothermalis]APQ16948.1 alpha-amylase [Maribacter hydrothermalis]OBR37209.1 alpha-amylase [Maribacter hydrothermalis]
MKSKIVIYHVFTRLFGNTNTNNKPWGTIEENGVGKLADFSKKALAEIKNLGITHIWYTGIPHHAVINDYSEFGISNDDPDVVKGRAGSPYAVKDYYNINPDLAVDPANRLNEFKSLVMRTHAAGMKVIIDIVPNHVARRYEGKTNPKGNSDFGYGDDTSVEYAKDNNFYYIPGTQFKHPEWRDGYVPLGGDTPNLPNSKLIEIPAKWTGNGSRSPQPDMNDWYETVRINYGVRPNGGLDFDMLPNDYGEKDYNEHFKYWKKKVVPSSWRKFREIAHYWLQMGVDGFRYDMAEMVPVEFWSYLNSSIKMKNPDAFIMAEVYNPDLYRTYIHKGKMDYLYDKVDFYDGIKHIMKGYGWSDHLPVVQNGLQDIEHNMLHFLENHDEQRIASPEFVGNAAIGKPAMVVSATISTSPTMIYFGQEVGEPAAENPGFGSPSRTSIFDYIGVPHHQRWVNDKKFDGGQLKPEESSLRDFYKRLLNFTSTSEALMGAYREIHFYNKEITEDYNHRVLSYVRWSENQKLIVVSNFDTNIQFSFDLKLPVDLMKQWQLTSGKYVLIDALYGHKNSLSIENGEGHIAIELNPLESFIFELKF